METIYLEGSPPAKHLSTLSRRQDFGELRRRLLIEPIVTDRCALLGALARHALIAEVELTPKPGLVDRRGSGAHTDLSLTLMIRSAFAIEPFIRRMASRSINQRPSPYLRATLAAIGRSAETAMLDVTNGTNTHKGAVWTLGLLAAAAAINKTGAFDPLAIARTAGLIASFEDPGRELTQMDANKSRLQFPSHGQIVAKRFQVTGARGQAISGFPHIIKLGLPMLRSRRRAHAPESIARLEVLLSIMAQLDDTCLLYRGGKVALQAAKQGAAAVIAAGGTGSARGRKLLYALDARLLDLGVSPGGSADLLAGTLFLDAIERGETRIDVSLD